MKDRKHVFFDFTAQDEKVRIEALELEMKTLAENISARLQTLQDMVEAVLMRP